MVLRLLFGNIFGSTKCIDSEAVKAVEDKYDDENLGQVLIQKVKSWVKSYQNRISRSEVSNPTNSNPTNYIRMKTGNQLLTATSTAGYVLAHPCVAVERWQWAINKSENCYLGEQVEFWIKGNDKMYQGYLQPSTNIIRTEGVQVNCHNKPIVMTETGNEVNLHSQHMDQITKVNLSGVITLNHDTRTGIAASDFLDSSWIYDQSDYHHVDLQRQVLDEVQQSIEASEVRVQQTKDLPIIWKLLNIRDETIFGIFTATLTWLDKALIMILCYKVFIYKWVKRVKRCIENNQYKAAVETI